jgi:ABC-type phosphate transport system substrate-binding protein
MKNFSSMASLAALSLAAAPAAFAGTTPATMNGGGAASQQFDYAAPDVNGKPVSEMFLFATLQNKADFGTYWSTTSKAAQTGLLQNDLTCIENASTGNNGGLCNNTPGGADTVHYAISETVLSAASIAEWSTSTWGQSAAGNLIQLPAMGTGLAIVVNDTNITANGKAVFSDADLCEIFSGGYTNFSQITDSATAPAAGAITLVYRADAAGTTFSLTNHLAAVCTTADTAPGITFTPTSSFSTLFSAIGTQLPGGLGVTGLATLANTMAGLTGTGPLPQAIGYISPDWTSVDSATSSAKLSNGEPSPLIVAALKNGAKAYLPVEKSIKLALTHIEKGTNPNPPSTAAQGANPALWVPVIQTVSTGYPIVTYSTIDIPQCYANPQITAGMIAFLLDHYNNASFKTIQSNNGLVAVTNTSAAKFVLPIRQNILANKNGWNTDIGDATACAGKAGR